MDFSYGVSEHEMFYIFAHPGLVIDAASRMPVGFGHMKVWSGDRSEGHKGRKSLSLYTDRPRVPPTGCATR